MNKSYSEESLLGKYLAYSAENPLEYSEFKYDKTEWDNIPILIPRFIVYISKNLEALSGYWK